MKQKFANALSLALIVAMLFTSLALADDISNDLDLTVDAAAEVMPLNAGGATGSTQLYVVPAGGDGKPGCNLTGSTTLGVSISSSNPSVASVSPATATFTSCGDAKTLTITPLSEGSATITVAQTSNNTGGTFNFAPATFTVNVVAPPPSNTAPTVVVSGVTGGASYNKGSVPAATCQVTDAEDGNSSFAADLSAVTGPYASDGIGEQTASCSYTDDGGLTASASETYNIIDPSAPSIDYTLDPASPDGSNGWYKSNVSLTWNVSELESPNSLQKTGCNNQDITADQAETNYDCSATSAGGSTGPVSVSIKRDATAPVIAFNGPSTSVWYTANVTANWSCSDVTSGPVSNSASATTSGEGNAVPATGACADNAGNSASDIQYFMVDQTDPTLTWNGGPAAGGSYYFGSVPAAPTCTASDDLSGPNGCAVSDYGTSVGSHTMTATANDVAGNSYSETRSYTVLAWTLNGFYQPVDMTPAGNPTVWNTVRGGSTVPLKFEVFAGTTELTATSIINQPLRATSVSCVGNTVDEIELTATGGTSLRYDTTGGQFIYNWQTPRQVGACYKVTVITADGSSIFAYFRLK